MIIVCQMNRAVYALPQRLSDYCLSGYGPCALTLCQRNNQLTQYTQTTSNIQP